MENRVSKFVDSTNVEKIKIDTLDNPGWIVRVYHDREFTRPEKHVVNLDKSDSDWFREILEGKTLTTVGDETKLIQCLLSVMKYFNIQMTPEIGEVLPYLKFLQTWYAEQCDEDWEHSYGVRATIDTNGYCHCSVDLCGTWGYLDEQDFEPVGDSSTFQCRKEGQQLVGEGHVCHILLFLKAFQNWVESVLKD